MVKRSKNFSRNQLNKSNFYFTIFLAIKKYGRLPKLNISKQRINYYVKQLLIDDIIEKIGYGTWKIKKEITKDYMPKRSKNFKAWMGARIQRSTGIKKVVKKHYVRGHGFMFSFSIPKIAGWHKRVKYLDSKKVLYDDLLNKNGVYGQRLFIRNHKIWVTDKKIVMFFSKEHSIISDSAISCRKIAIKEALKTINSLERLFGVSMSRNKNYDFKILKKHYAEIDNELAKKYAFKRKILSIRDDLGEEWLQIDNSLNLHELETTNKKTAEIDMDDVIKPFFNDLRGNPVTTNELLNLMRLIVIQHNETVKNVKDLSAGLQTLIMAIYPEGFKTNKKEKDFVNAVDNEKPNYIS